MLLHCHPDGYAKAKGAGTSDTKVETISKESDRVKKGVIPSQINKNEESKHVVGNATEVKSRVKKAMALAKEIRPVWYSNYQ